MVQDSNERRVIDHGEVTIKSKPESRQASEVGAMRYVLGISVSLAVVGLLAAYMLVS